jgi:hypothetical protein
VFSVCAGKEKTHVFGLWGKEAESLFWIPTVQPKILFVRTLNDYYFWPAFFSEFFPSSFF